MNLFYLWRDGFFEPIGLVVALQLFFSKEEGLSFFLFSNQKNYKDWPPIGATCPVDQFRNPVG